MCVCSSLLSKACVRDEEYLRLNIQIKLALKLFERREKEKRITMGQWQINIIYILTIILLKINFLNEYFITILKV